MVEDEISTSWYVRNYNLLFTMRLVVITFFLLTMQYLQILQVFLSFLVMLTFLIFNVIKFRKYKFFEDRLTKVARVIQDISFTVMMAFVCILYFEQKSSTLNETLKLVIIGSFAILVIINILLEIGIMVKELGSSCCRKKDEQIKEN